MIGGLLEVHFDDALVVIRQRGTAVDDFAARIGCAWQPPAKLQSRFTEQRRIHTIVGEWSSQRNRPAAIASRGCKSCEIARQHRWRRNERSLIRRILAERRALITGKEKQFVLCDWAANRSTKLVTFDRVTPCREGVSAIEDAVPDKLKSIAMEFVGTGLRDKTHGAAGLAALFGGGTTRLDSEFLQRIRERKRNIAVVGRILMMSTV